MRTMCMVLLASLGWLAPNVAVGELPAEPSVLSQVGDAGPQRAHPQAWTLTGTVAETVNTGKGRVWCAGP